MEGLFHPPAIRAEALGVDVVDGEIVVGGQVGVSLTPAAARETGRRLLAAADTADRAD